MALTTVPLPFGLRDVKLYPVDINGTRLSVGVDLPASRVFSFKDTQEFTPLEGDDVTYASHGGITTVDWELESGGIPFEAYKIMAGGTITSSGTTPNQKKVYSKLATDERPYFDVEGQAISDSGGDVHGLVYRVKAEGDLEGKFENGQFSLLSASGKGYGRLDTGQLYDFVQNETITPIVTSIAPQVFSVTPGTGSNAGGTATTIKGINFIGTTGVTFGGTTAPGFVVVDQNTITVASPAHAAGTVAVVVTTPSGTGTLTAGFIYT